MSDFEITDSFSEPFYGGAVASTTDDRSMPVSLDGRAYLVDLSSQQFSRRSVQLLNTQQAQGDGDQSSTAPEVWRRSIESWHHGAGQTRFDRSDSLPTRFHASFGVDPWTKNRLSLLPKTEALLSLGAGESASLRSIGKVLFVILTSTVRRYADPTTSSAYTSEALGADAVAVTCDGENLYVLDDAGVIHRYDSIAATWNHSWATVASFDPTKAMLAYVKGFIVVGNGPDLWDYTNPAAPTLIYTHRIDGWHWRAASEGLSVVYILGGMGDRWHIHRVGISSTGAALDPPIVAATLPEGEFAYTIATYLGYVLIGVNSGWRFGMPDGAGNITYGQVIRTPRPVKAFECQDRFVWFGLSIASSLDEDGSEGRIYSEYAGLGRADLSAFIAPMTPAAASDVYGLLQYGTTTDVVTVGGEDDGFGKRVFAVEGTTGGGVYIERDALVPAGWLTQGLMTFNSTDPKVGLYAQAFHGALLGEVSLAVGIDDSDTYIQIGTNTSDGSTSMGNMAYSAQFQAIEFKYTLYVSADSPTDGPVVKRAEMRAVNVPGRATEWQIPLFVHERIEYAGQTHNNDVAEDYDFLMGLVQSRRRFTYREGDRTWQLYATDFLWTPYQLTSTGETYQGTFLLVAREIN